MKSVQWMLSCHLPFGSDCKNHSKNLGCERINFENAGQCRKSATGGNHIEGGGMFLQFNLDKNLPEWMWQIVKNRHTYIGPKRQNKFVISGLDFLVFKRVIKCMYLLDIGYFQGIFLLFSYSFLTNPVEIRSFV